MKIGFDAKRLYNNFTGLGNYSRTLVTNLMRLYPEDKIVLYTPKLKIKPLNGTQTITPRKRKLTWRSWGIKKDILKENVQIYHGLSHDLPFGIHKTDIKCVVTIHDVCYRTYPDMFPMLERIIYGIKYSYSCRHAHKIIAISESTKADIIKYFGTSADKIEVIYQSINPVFYTQQPDPKQTIKTYKLPEKYILYVGSINSRKNLMGIIKAYQYLSAENSLPLVVVGNGSSYKDKVMRMIQDYNLEDKVLMFDSINDLHTLQAFYQCAELFVYPSFYEGFGLPVTEALLSGTPVITSSISSLPEAGGDAALYVNPTEPQEIAAAIERILTDTELRAQMVAKGLKYAREKFDPDTLTRQVHELYESL